MARSPYSGREVSRFKVAIGATIFESEERVLAKFEVDDQVDRLSMFTAWFNFNPERRERLRPVEVGQTFEGAVGYGREFKTLLAGEVTALELELTESGSMLVARGYDRMHRLRTGRKTRTFENVRDSDVVVKIAKEAGLEPKVASTAEVRPYIAQRNLTDMEFVYALARKNFCLARVEDRTLVFDRPGHGQEVVLELQWGRDLREFNLRVNGLDQVSTVVVRGWDDRDKQPIVGRATAADVVGTGGQRLGLDVVAQAFGARHETVVDVPVDSQNHANLLARAVLNERAQSYVAGEGVTRGDPALRAGTSVRVAGVDRFSGDYYITGSRHLVDSRLGYQTTFQFRGNALGESV